MHKIKYEKMLKNKFIYLYNMEPTLLWDIIEKSVILTKSNGIQIYLRKKQTIQFSVDKIYGCPNFGQDKFIVRVDDFFGYEEEDRYWGLKYSVLNNDGNWDIVSKSDNHLCDIHYNEDIWDTIEMYNE